MPRRSRWRNYGPRPSIPNPRAFLLAEVLAFVRAAQLLPGVRRISLVGSLATDKPIPKDADVLVVVDDANMDFKPLATVGRRLEGKTQTINLGADIFIADATHRYLGRTCSYRECHWRASCTGLSCFKGLHLKDDLEVVTLKQALIDASPADLWPSVVRRCKLPADTEMLLLAKLETNAT